MPIKKPNLEVEQIPHLRSSGTEALQLFDLNVMENEVVGSASHSPTMEVSIAIKSAVEPTINLGEYLYTEEECELIRQSQDTDLLDTLSRVAPEV